MAKGYYLSRTDGIFATQKTPYHFDRFCQSLPRKGQNKNRKYFIPQFECTEEFRAKNIPCEEQLNNDVLDQLAANVDFNSDDQMDNLNKQFKKARIQKTLTDTKLQNQKLEERKRELYYDWSERFFNSFADHFGKLKNMIIELHLNEEQVKKFNQCLDNCLQNLQLNLNEIYDQFMQEQQNEQK